MSNLQSWAGVDKVMWTSVLNEEITLGSLFKIVPTEGYLAWEYNPLRNYRLNENMYEKDGKYYTLQEFQKITNFTGEEKDLPNDWTLLEAGELVDFITNELSFNISNPVDILPQYSYDGSVNLILNDGLNIPRLINSRFTVTGRNTYKVIDRKGDNDTNIYDLGEQFDVDTSLFKNVNKIPKLEYLGTSNGNMKIGNYHFYFKYADADGNESDWVAESGLVSVFIGTSPQSVNTGIRDENSIKSVRFRLSNIDIGYSFVKIYYTRYSADIDSNFIVEAKRIDKNFIVNNSGTCMILITGDEDSTEVTLEEINSSFDVIQNAQTLCTAANRLFMANVHKSKIEYDTLSKLSLCFCPSKIEEPYPLINLGMDLNYYISSKEDGYYDSKYIYDKTGYWPGELYRLGIVYILKDGSLSPVFNIRGATNISTSVEYKIDDDLKRVKSLKEALSEIDYSEEDYMIIGGIADNENAKGIILLSQYYTTDQPFSIVGIRIKAHQDVIKELKKYSKGFFFVRQKRIPLTLCQGIVIGLDNESRTPTLPTLGGVTSLLNLDNTFVETSDVNDINYISEGFLSRYTYKIKEKSTGFWKKMLKTVAVVATLAVAAVATVVTCGAAAVATGVALAAAAASTATALGTIGVVSAVTLGVAATTVTTLHFVLKARNKRSKSGDVKALKGRNTEISKGYKREEIAESRLLLLDVFDRYIIKDPSKNSPDAIIVPDYQVNQPYYNQFLTGGNFTVKLTYELPNHNYLDDGYFTSDLRHFYVEQYKYLSDNRSYSVKLVGVPDGCPIKMISENKYCARAGYAEEAYKYEFQGTEYDDSTNKKDNSDIIRGNYGSFVGMNGYTGHACDQINIMIPGYKENDLFNYIQLRAQDTSAFYAISDRIDINNINNTDNILQLSEKEDKPYDITLYRGDSYICLYTHRINRNFNDPSAPYNDKIVDEKSWRNNYNPDKPEDYSNINLGDVNAVLLGMWLTFWVRSSYNLNIRTIDKSNVDEYLMCGNYRSFYPHYGLLADGNQKIPDSNQYNKGFTKSVSEKYYFEVPDVPYIKQEFQNRIVFSDIHINDAYKNGFRVLRTMNHKDYPMTHGSITKLVELKNSLLIVFEHGIGLVAIDNSAEHASQILSDLNIISDTYGSLWKDSIIKTPSGIYGVDTVAKKIWRVKEGQIELISDMRVQEFLNQNITLTEREVTPIIGIRNVKTVYNAFKHDVMFTFYDNLQDSQEKSWNLCWNELLGIFTTFYSWIPSEMQNIDNIPFSFDRDSVKNVVKLGISNHKSDFALGITLTNNVINIGLNSFSVNNKELYISYIDDLGIEQKYEFNTTLFINENSDFVAFLHLDKITIPNYKTSCEIEYSLLRDSQKNHNLFDIKQVELTPENSDKAIKVSYLSLDVEKLKNLTNNVVLYLNIRANIKLDEADWGYYDFTVALITNNNLQNLSTDFWKHGQAGLIDVCDKILPTTWYGLLHPFEFECIVVDDPSVHKIFTNLELVANKVKPESFHYEIVGDVYDFSEDKPTMYFRLEALKALYLYNDYDIEYNPNFIEIEPKQHNRSTDLPKYYSRWNGLNEIYDSYKRFSAPIGFNYDHLAGAEVVYYPTRNEFRIWNHVEAIDVDSLSQDLATSVIKANCQYLEDKWLVGINPIVVTYKNELTYDSQKRLVVNDLYTPLDNSLDEAKYRSGLFAKDKFNIYKYSSWVKSKEGSTLLPPINILGTKLEEKLGSNIQYPGDASDPKGGKDNALYGLYDLTEWDKGEWRPIDPTKNKERRETDVRGKFIKVRIRYSGEELAIIDFLNTIYQISFA